MNWRNILLPWSVLKEVQEDIVTHMNITVRQTKKIANLEQDISVQKERIRLLLKQNEDLDLQLRSARLANTILKDDLRKMSAIIEDFPKRNEKGRFASKKSSGSSAEAPTAASAKKS